MILKKLKAWFKSLGNKKALTCSVLAVASVACFATACKDPENGPETTYYTITFNTNGGSAINPVEIEEGSVIARPANPQLNGSTFVGWYADRNFKTPFYFNESAKANADVTLYARWEVENPNDNEYVIDFNTGVEGLTIENIETVNQKVFVDQLTVPTQSGYKFDGWAISMYDDASKLSYMSEDAMKISEHTTFHAVWSPVTSTTLATPVVDVDANGISWNSIAGATYHVTVVGPEGFEAVSTNVGTTTYAVNFATAPIGDYEISVTAFGSDESKNSQPAVRYYVNKMLPRVSFFSVEDTTFTFEEVENATDYALTIVCGDKKHNHVNVPVVADEETGVYAYDFANCVTKTGKVDFVVTASADGYVSSQSRTYSFEKVLDEVTGIAVDESTGIVTWNAVENAEKYVVSVDCGTASHTHNKVVVGATQFDLKTCANGAEGIKVSVYAVADTFGDSVPATYVYDKTVLATPSNVKIVDTTMTWDEVEGATAYKVKVGDSTFDVTSNSFDFANFVELVEANQYVVNVQAVNGTNDSVWSNDIDARYLALATSLTYADGYVSWNYVIGATSYNVSVNGGEAFVVDSGVNYTPVTFTQSGVNTISVSFTDGTTTSEAATVEVTAYKVSFNLNGETSAFVTVGAFADQYKAVGDSVESFYPEFKAQTPFGKVGHTFHGWYKSETLGAGNAKIYEDVTFNEAGDITLYADYTANVYTIKYNYGDGTNGSSPVTETEVTYGEEFQFVVPNSVGEVQFEGWYTLPGASGTMLTDETGAGKGAWLFTDDESGVIEVYAYWRDNVLTFKETKLAGNPNPVWAVSKGSRIDMVTTVTIPELYRNKPVKLVEAHGFKDSTKLKSINIPNTVEQIFTGGASSFDGCTQLEAINVYEVEGNSVVRYYSEDGVLFDYGRIDEQDGSVSLAIFPAKYPSTSYRVPEGVTKIATDVFKYSLIEEIIFSPDIEEIESEAFYSASELKTVTFEPTPADVEAKPLVIGGRAFYSCSKLEDINLPARLVEIGTIRAMLYGETVTSGPAYQNVATSHTNNTPINDAFLSCSKLKNINVEEGGEYYSSENGVLYNADKSILLYVPRYNEPVDEDGKFTIPSSVTTIAQSAFYYAYNYKEIYIPSTVTTIEELAFYNAYYIEKVTFGGGGFDPVSIGDYAFRNASGLEELVFEPGSQITEIGNGVFFASVYKMKTLTIPKTVTNLGDNAFRGWYELEEIIFEEPENIGDGLTFGDGVFYGATKLKSLTIPKHAVELGGLFNGLDKLKSVAVAEGNTHYDTFDGILYDIAMTTMLYFPKEIGDGEYTLPATLTTIGANVFKGNTKLTTFTVPNTVTTISDNAFSESRIATFTFAAGGTEPLSIGKNAFSYAARIKNLALPDRTATISEYAFAYMDSLETLTLGNTIEALGAYAICYNPALTTVTIPDTVKSIGYYGLGRNTALTTVNFGEKSQLEELRPYALAYNTALRAIELPASLKKIGYQAFVQATNTAAPVLKDVTFAEGSVLEEIGPYAFQYTKIESITIPKTVTNIGPYAFYYCNRLTEVNFEEGGTAPLTIGAMGHYIITASGVGTPNAYYGYSFYYTRISSIEFPKRLTEIGAYSFAYCYWLEEATLEGYVDGVATTGFDSNLQQIGQYAFYHCEALKSFTFPKSMTNLAPVRTTSTASASAYSNVYPRAAIERYAFYCCYELEDAIFEQGGDRPMTISSGAFYDCHALTEVDLPSRLVTYEAVDPLKNTTVQVMKPLGDILSSGGAPLIFGNCHALTDINVITNEDGTPYIAENEYFSVDGVIYSQSLTEIIRAPIGKTSYEVPNTVERIDDYAFARCVVLEELTFEAGNDDVALVIGEEAFRQCYALTEIVLAKRVTEIGKYAFLNCTELEKVDLSTYLTTFDATVFDGCSKLEMVNAAADSTTYTSFNGIVFNKAATEADVHTLYYYPASRADKTYTIPASVKTIYDYAFYNNATLEEVFLPDGLEAIGDYAFYNATGLKAINIKKNVTNIGDYAFYNCANLEILTFEEGGSAPLVIGNEEFVNQSSYYKVGSSWKYVDYGYVFAYCPLVTSVTLPERTRVVADNAFAYCYGLRTINVPASVEKLGNAAFLSCERLEEVEFNTEHITAFPYRLFMYCRSLKSFEIPATITSFTTDSYSSYKQSLAFAYCTSLESVTFAEGCEIEVLPRSVFYNCESLKAIEIPASVVEILSGSTGTTNAAAFAGCTALESVTFAEGSQLTTIGNYAFYKCHSLATIELPETVESLGIYVFNECKSLDNVVIPADCYLDESYGLFYNCESLKTYELPEMSILPSSFFYGCKSITEIDLSQYSEVYDYVLGETGVTEVTVYADTYYEYSPFANMYELKKVNFEDGFDGFVDEFFYYCTALEEIEIPDSVTNLSYYLFSGCHSLTSVKLPNNEDLTSLGSGTFYECTSLETLTIPETVTAIDDELFSSSGITEITIPSSVEYISYYAFYWCENLETVNISETTPIDYIGEYAFNNCTSLKNITLPNALTSIEAYAFGNCTSLESINIPEMCVGIDSTVFLGCTALEEFVIAEGNTYYNGENVEDGIIWNGAHTQIVGVLPQKTGSYTVPEGVTLGVSAFANSALTEIVLPSTLTTIPNYAFAGANIETIVIPESVTLIGDYAFNGSSIQSITIPSAVTFIGKYSFQNCSDLETITIAGGDTAMIIGECAFQFCKSLTELTVPYRVRATSTASGYQYAIGSKAFMGCSNLETVTFEETPAEDEIGGVLNFGTYAFMFCNKITEIEFPAALADNGTSYYALASYAFYSCVNLETVTFNVPEETENTIEIAGQAFAFCTSLTNIEIPSNCVYISGGAFMHTAIESITIPAAVADLPTTSCYTYVEDPLAYNGMRSESYISMGGQFYGCTALTTVVIETTEPIIPTRMFEGCTALTSVTFNTEAITQINDYAFKGCTALTSITLPTTLTTFGANVFEGWSAAQTVNVNRTEKEINRWSVLWNKGCEATIAYLQ